MAWLPDHIWLALKAAKHVSKGKGKGKAKGKAKGSPIMQLKLQKSGFGKGGGKGAAQNPKQQKTLDKLGKIKGKAKGKAKGSPIMQLKLQKSGFGKGGGKGAAQNPKQQKTLDKLGKIDQELKVWVGGLPKDAKRGQLFSHFKDVCKPREFELMSKGTACVAFKTAEDAQLAIDSLNGSEIDGKSIKVDVWKTKEKKERKEGDRPKKKAKSVIKTSFLKSKKGKKAAAPSGKKGKKAADSPMTTKIKAVEHNLKVWVGGLSEKTTWKELKQHFVDTGCEVDMAGLMKPGTACVTFKTEEAATAAVGTMNGTALAGNPIEVDVWTKPERKERKKKETSA